MMTCKKCCTKKLLIPQSHTYVHMNMNEYSNSTTSNIPETSLKEKLDYIQIGKVDRKFKKTLFQKRHFSRSKLFHLNIGLV